MKPCGITPPPNGDLFDPSPAATPLPTAKPRVAAPHVRLVRFDDAERPAVARGASPGPRRTRRWGAQIEMLLAVLRASFETRGVPPEIAEGHAKAALLALADYGGGRDFYLPRAVVLKAAIRDEAIRREFNGRNLDEVALRHGLTTRRVRAILSTRPPRT